MTETAERMLQGKRARWRIAEPMPAELRSQLGELSVMLSHLLYRRGYRTVEQIEGFFSQGLVSHDPALLPDIALAITRIERAIEAGERVAIYGDFDCDGLTATSVLAATLTALGLDPIVHVPSRDDGHGLQPEALASLADRGVTLIITADCGVAAIEEVSVARGMGMDVIITDHHEARVDGSLPDCPTVAPTRHDSLYPFRSLCGVGVAYKLAQALAERHPIVQPDDLLDLVALGTVADVVPLRDENRSLVIRGLARLRATDRPGLRALFRVAKVDPVRIDPVAVSFYLAPRINAANRMASPQLAYDLINASDTAQAETLAAELHRHNEQRQQLVAETFAGIVAQIGDAQSIRDEVLTGMRPPVLLVTGPWPPGISGLLATKLVDMYGLPAFVGSDVGEGTASVSARGLAGVHIDELLEACESSQPGGLFLGHGGHARAGGFRVDAAKLETVRAVLDEQCRLQVPVEALGATLEIDAEVEPRTLTMQAARLITSIAPFGVEFEEPLFLVRRVRVCRLSPMGDGKHVRVSLQRDGSRIKGVYFGAPREFATLPIGSVIDIACHLQISEWNGLSMYELRLRDWRLSA